MSPDRIGRIVSVAALTVLVTLLAGPAWSQPATFPNDDSFATAMCKSGVASDPALDFNGAKKKRDVVGNSKHPALATYDDGTWFFLRIRLNENPLTTDGKKPLGQFGWGIGFDADGDLSTIEYAAIVNGISETLDLIRYDKSKTILKQWKPTLNTKKSGPSGQTYAPVYVEVRKAADGSEFAGTPDWFMTVAVHMGQAAQATAASKTPLKWGKINLWVATSSSSKSLDKDFMCWDDTKGKVKIADAVVNPIVAGTFVKITAPASNPVKTKNPKIEGMTEPGVKVTVALNGKAKTVTADKAGKWSLQVDDTWGLQNGKTYTIIAKVSDDGTGAAAKDSLVISIKVLSVLPTCSDKKKNGNETDVDCGGSCPTACTVGKKCKAHGDCSTGLCDSNAGICLAKATCSDKKKNGSETDVDCGGSCKAKCADGKHCNAGSDCASASCGGKPGICLPKATCSDKKKNGSETDVDCGGSCNVKCADGKKCKVGGDCASADCDSKAGICMAKPACSDNKKNGNETDVDCGGSCKTTCAEGKKCKVGGDCSTALCDSKTGVCLAKPTCSDKKKNGSETDIDCGGSCPDKCADSKACTVKADCKSDICDFKGSKGVCLAKPTCSDGQANGGETDVDCGGPCTAKCATGKGCGVNADCVSVTCDAKAKVPICIEPDHCINGKQDKDETDVDCGGSCAVGCKDGQGCAGPADCAGGKCNTKVDPPVCGSGPSCTDGELNGSETDVDCGGACPEKCVQGETCEGDDDCATKLCDVEADAPVCAKPASCSDGEQNGDETDVDCGGSCTAGCALGQGCGVDGDCDGSVCDTEAVAPICVAPISCSDGELNGDETDVDCGGSCPGGCVDGKGCQTGSDCKSALCAEDASPKLCIAAPTCSDGIQNSDETDVDCGGGCPTECANGQGCSHAGDCVSGKCGTPEQPLVCSPAANCSDGKQNGSETDVDCGGSCAEGCAKDQLCGGDADCQTGWCSAGKVCVRGCPDAADPNDCDGDGLANKDEDADNDGQVGDGETDPFEADSDQDGIDDGAEKAAGTNPVAADLKLLGGGCGSGPQNTGHLPLVLLVLGAMALLALRRRRIASAQRPSGGPGAALSAVVALVAILSASPAEAARAGSFSLLRFRPPPNPMGLLHTDVGRPLGHLASTAGVYMHYDHRPLVFVGAASGAEEFDEVSYQLTAQVVGAIGLFDVLEVGVAAPYAMAQGTGDRPDKIPAVPDIGGGTGDARLYIKARFFHRGPVDAALVAPILLPTGDADSYLGDDGLGIEPQLALSADWGRVALAANLGWRIRPNRSFSPALSDQDIKVEDELSVSAGARLSLIAGKLDAMVDWSGIYGAAGGAAVERGGEVLAGLRAWLPRGLVASVAAGPGIGHGMGVPTMRAICHLAWMPPRASSSTKR